MSRNREVWSAGDFAAGGKYDASTQAALAANFPSCKVMFDWMDTPTTQGAQDTTVDKVSGVQIGGAPVSRAADGTLFLDSISLAYQSGTVPAVPAGHGALVIATKNKDTGGSTSFGAFSASAIPSTTNLGIRPIPFQNIAAQAVAASSTELLLLTINPTALVGPFVASVCALRPDAGNGYLGSVTDGTTTVNGSVNWIVAPVNLTLNNAYTLPSFTSVFMSTLFYFPVAKMPNAAEIRSIAAWQQWAATQYPTNGNRKWLCPLLYKR